MFFLQIGGGFLRISVATCRIFFSSPFISLLSHRGKVHQRFVRPLHFCGRLRSLYRNIIFVSPSPTPLTPASFPGFVSSPDCRNGHHFIFPFRRITSSIVQRCDPTPFQKLPSQAPLKQSFGDFFFFRIQSPLSSGLLGPERETFFFR